MTPVDAGDAGDSPEEVVAGLQAHLQVVERAQRWYERAETDGFHQIEPLRKRLRFNPEID